MKILKLAFWSVTFWIYRSEFRFFEPWAHSGGTMTLFLSESEIRSGHAWTKFHLDKETALSAGALNFKNSFAVLLTNSGPPQDAQNLKL